MQIGHKNLPKKYSAQISFVVMMLLAYFGAQNISTIIPVKAYKTSTFNVSVENTQTSFYILPTTSTTIVETIKEVEETTTTNTTLIKIKSTTTSTTITVDKYLSVDGPPHNISTLVGCISYYESTWGIDPNVFQFTQQTWEAYGGTGSPSRAIYSIQEKIFWKAWEDDGFHHWAAQKGRCF